MASAIAHGIRRNKDDCFYCGKRVAEKDNAKYLICDNAFSASDKDFRHPRWHDNCALQWLDASPKIRPRSVVKATKCPCEDCAGHVKPTTLTIAKSFYRSSVPASLPEYAVLQIEYAYATMLHAQNRLAIATHLLSFFVICFRQEIFRFMFIPVIIFALVVVAEFVPRLQFINVYMRLTNKSNREMEHLPMSKHEFAFAKFFVALVAWLMLTEFTVGNVSKARRLFLLLHFLKYYSLRLYVGSLEWHSWSMRSSGLWESYAGASVVVCLLRGFAVSFGT